MTRRRGQFVGLVVDERALRAADASGRVAETAVGADAASDPAALGQSLRASLTQAGINARSVMVGVPGRWLAVRSRAMPPAGGAALAGAVALAAEREFPGQSEQLIVDYTPDTTTADSPRVLIAALPVDRLTWLRSLVAAAGLRLAGVTPTAAASSTGLTLHLLPNQCELSWTDAGQLVMLQHLGVTLNGASKPDHDPADVDATLRSLSAEVRRALATHDAPADALHIDDAVGLTPPLLKRIGAQLAMPLRQGGGGAANVKPAFAPAARLAALNAEALPLDFVNPRTRREAVGRVPRWARVAIGAGAAVLLVAVAFSINVMMMQRTIADHDAWESLHETEIARAERLREDLRVARGWVEDRPGHLEALRTLTLAFPERPDVWASSVSLGESGEGVVSGRARNERDVLDLLNRLQADGTMPGAKLAYVRAADGARSGDVSFAITLPAREEER